MSRHRAGGYQIHRHALLIQHSLAMRLCGVAALMPSAAGTVVGWAAYLAWGIPRSQGRPKSRVWECPQLEMLDEWQGDGGSLVPWDERHWADYLPCGYSGFVENLTGAFSVIGPDLERCHPCSRAPPDKPTAMKSGPVRTSLLASASQQSHSPVLGQEPRRCTPFMQSLGPVEVPGRKALSAWQKRCGEHSDAHLDFLSLQGRVFGGDAAPLPTRFPEGLQAAQSWSYVVGVHL